MRISRRQTQKMYFFHLTQMAGHSKSNKEKAPEPVEKDTPKPSPDSSKTNSREETDLY